MISPTDFQGYRPAVGDARRGLGSVAPATWRNTTARGIAMPATGAIAIQLSSVKRHANFTDRPSEAPT